MVEERKVELNKFDCYRAVVERHSPKGQWIRLDNGVTAFSRSSLPVGTEVFVSIISIFDDLIIATIDSVIYGKVA